jgi:exosortase/archaeosortase family protein
VFSQHRFQFANRMQTALANERRDAMRYPLILMLGPTALMLGLLLLALHPLLWLVGTWFDPAYDSYGIWVAALTGGLLLWSATSPLRTPVSRQRLNGIGLLALTAAVRLLGQWLGINTLGAAALAVDVYAIGLLLELDRRARPLAPGWLAVLFAFALPIERILQRGFGFALQQLSASGACAALKLGSRPVQCEGIQLQWREQTVLVDLPCSGTRGLLLLLLLFVTLAVLTRPTLRRALLGALLTLAAATLGNSLRIVGLATGLVHRDAGRRGCAGRTLAQHDGPHDADAYRRCLCCFGRDTEAAAQFRFRPFPLIPRSEPAALLSSSLHRTGFLARLRRNRYAAAAAAGCGPAAARAGITRLHRRFRRATRRADRSGAGLLHPLRRRRSAGRVWPLRPAGGEHHRAATPSPSPEECLAGAVTRCAISARLGGPIPSAMYHTTDPQGRVWRMTVSIVSERGDGRPTSPKRCGDGCKRPVPPGG